MISLIPTVYRVYTVFKRHLNRNQAKEVHRTDLERGVVNAELTLDNQALIETMTKDESYRYLGILQLMGACHTDVKEIFTAAFVKRLRAILETSLNSANKIKTMLTPTRFHSSPTLSGSSNGLALTWQM